MCKIVDVFILVGLLCCAIHDWRKKEVPVIFIIGIGLIAIFSVLFFRMENVWDMLSGVLIGLCCLIISQWTRQAVGYGDSLLILILGVYLGGIRLLQMLFVSTFGAGIFALFCLWKRKWRRNASIPFIPFLTLAYMGVMFI